MPLFGEGMLSGYGQTYEMIWGWYARPDKPGVFEIDWQMKDGVNRIAMALESRQVAIVDVSKIPALDTAEYRQAQQAMQSTAGQGS